MDVEVDIDVLVDIAVLVVAIDLVIREEDLVDIAIEE